MIARLFFIIMVAALFWAVDGFGEEADSASHDRVLGGFSVREAPQTESVYQDSEDMPLGGDRPKDSGTVEKERSPWGVIMNIMGGIFLLVVIFVAGAVAFRRLVLGGKGGYSGKCAEVLSRTCIDNRRYVALMRVGRRVLVVGVYPDGMSALGEITDPDEVADIMRTARPVTEEGKGVFLNLLKGGIDERASLASEVPGGESAELAREVEDIRSRLRGLRREN